MSYALFWQASVFHLSQNASLNTEFWYKSQRFSFRNIWHGHYSTTRLVLYANRKKYVIIMAYCPGISWIGWSYSTKTSALAVCVLDEIILWHQQNLCLQCYCFNQIQIKISCERFWISKPLNCTILKAAFAYFFNKEQSNLKNLRFMKFIREMVPTVTGSYSDWFLQWLVPTVTGFLSISICIILMSHSV